MPEPDRQGGVGIDAARSEVAALLSLAAQGAGLPHGLCPDFVAAALCHLPEDPFEGMAAEVTLSFPGGNRAGRLAWLAPSAADLITLGQTPVDLRPEHPLYHSYLRARGLVADAPPVPERMTVPSPLWHKMQRLAERTYVPDSVISRRGAGSVRDAD